jgi:imidazolonepropionase-like amidohydrolase
VDVDVDVDVVKVMVSGGNVTPGSLPWESQFDRDALRRLVTAAREHGLPVAAHAHGTPGTARLRRRPSRRHRALHLHDRRRDRRRPAVPERAGRIRHRGPQHTRLGPRGPPPPPAIAARIAQLMPVIARLRDLGARLVVSTDAGIGPGKPHNVMAYAVHQVGSMTGDPIDALARATSAAADALGLTGVSGRLAPGRAADLLVVRGDPTSDLTALLEVKAGYRDGEQVTGPSIRPAPARS